jgi:hypothetical protein
MGDLTPLRPRPWLKAGSKDSAIEWVDGEYVKELNGKVQEVGLMSGPGADDFVTAEPALVAATLLLYQKLILNAISEWD